MWFILSCWIQFGCVELHSTISFSGRASWDWTLCLMRHGQSLGSPLDNNAMHNMPPSTRIYWHQWCALGDLWQMFACCWVLGISVSAYSIPAVNLLVLSNFHVLNFSCHGSTSDLLPELNVKTTVLLIVRWKTGAQQHLSHCQDHSTH